MRNKYLLALGLILTGCASPQWESAVRHKNTVYGGGIDGCCAIYARQLQALMKNDGVPTKRVTFTLSVGGQLPYSVLHQILAYEVDEESWFIGNDNPVPVWVGHIQDPWEHRIRQFYKGINVVVSDIVVQ